MRMNDDKWMYTGGGDVRWGIGAEAGKVEMLKEVSEVRDAATGRVTAFVERWEAPPREHIRKAFSRR